MLVLHPEHLCDSVAGCSAPDVAATGSFVPSVAAACAAPHHNVAGLAFLGEPCPAWLQKWDLCTTPATEVASPPTAVLPLGGIWPSTSPYPPLLCRLQASFGRQLVESEISVLLAFGFHMFSLSCDRPCLRRHPAFLSAFAFLGLRLRWHLFPSGCRLWPRNLRWVPAVSPVNSLLVQFSNGHALKENSEGLRESAQPSLDLRELLQLIRICSAHP